MFTLDANVKDKRKPVVKFFGEQTINFHSSTYCNSVVFVNPLLLPGIEEGDIIYIRTEKSETPTIFLEVR